MWYEDYHRSKKWVIRTVDSDDDNSTTANNYGGDWSLIEKIPTTTGEYL